ncbi:MAG: LON peptidase substrate-binding domain-containing protein, partial [Bacteroidota bacterium]
MSSQFLPLFPLSLVVYPGEMLRLHIFEPRYRQLINECVEENRTFGIPAVIDKSIRLTATELRVVSVDRTLSGGEMDVTTQGLRRFQIRQFFKVSPDKLYPGGLVEWLPEDYTSDPELQQEIFHLLEQMYEALGISSRRLSSWQE